MPTVTDSILTVVGVGVQVRASQFVQFVNNSTGTPYVSAAASNANGQFTITGVPAGSYTVNYGPSAAGPWTATGDTNYLVAPTAADNTSTFPGLVTVPSLTVSGAASFTAGPLSFPAGSIPLSAVSGGAPTASPTFTGTVTLPGAFVNGSASTIVGAVVGGLTDSVVSLNDAWTIQPTAHDQVGVYLRTYGVISALPSPRILNTLNATTAPQFTFTTPQSGDVLASELQVTIQGGATGGNFTGSLRGAYPHVDFSGTGNGITVANVWGLRADVGTSSTGSGYTVTNATAIYAGTPTAAGIGTITNALSIFAESTVGIGGTQGSPNLKLNPAGGIIMTDSQWLGSGVGNLLRYDAGTLGVAINHPGYGATRAIQFLGNNGSGQSVVAQIRTDQVNSKMGYARFGDSTAPNVSLEAANGFSVSAGLITTANAGPGINFAYAATAAGTGAAPTLPANTPTGATGGALKYIAVQINGATAYLLAAQ